MEYEQGRTLTETSGYNKSPLQLATFGNFKAVRIRQYSILLSDSDSQIRNLSRTINYGSSRTQILLSQDCGQWEKYVVKSVVNH
jgi:hypothetical protein